MGSVTSKRNLSPRALTQHLRQVVPAEVDPPYVRQGRERRNVLNGVAWHLHNLEVRVVADDINAPDPLVLRQVQKRRVSGRSRHHKHARGAKEYWTM